MQLSCNGVKRVKYPFIQLFALVHNIRLQYHARLKRLLFTVNLDGLLVELNPDEINRFVGGIAAECSPR